MKHVTLIRHAETEANAAGVWQGQGDAALSEAGRAQARVLGRRLAGIGFSRVVSSDLVRALDTAHVAGLEPVPDAAWREMDIGVWEGLTRDLVWERFGDEMTALASGEDVPMGGGETRSAFGARARSALGSLVADMEDGEHVAVLTHGGVVHAAVSAVLGIRGRTGPWPMDRVRNTALTELAVVEGRIGVIAYNDVSHLGSVPAEHSTLVSLIRHGESAANVLGEWHGSSDGPLSERGRAQATALAERLPAPDRVYASPLERARDTAVPLAAAHGLVVEVHEGLVEMDLGAWEGLTEGEIATGHADDWAAVFEHGRDLPRGGTGETFAAAAARGRAALDEVVRRHPGERLAVVSHGAMIRAIVTDVLGVPWPASRLLGIVRNTAVSSLRFGDRGPVVVDYNV